MKVSEIKVGQVFSIPVDADDMTYTLVEGGMLVGTDSHSNTTNPFPASDLGGAEVFLCADVND